MNRRSPEPAERQGVKRVVQLFANPHSGGFNPARLHYVVSELKGQGAEVLVTLDAPFLLAGPFITEIFVMGGDGTIRDAVSCLIRADVDLPVRILPTGTVNLISRELSERQESDAATTYYTGVVNGHAMLMCASGGPDAHIVAMVSPLLKRWIGRGAYLVSALRQLLAWREDRFRLELEDGRTIVCTAFYLAKGRYYAGPWSFAPQASGCEALFHGVALTKGGRLNYLRFAVEMLLGRPTMRKGLTRFSCESLGITSSAPAPVQIDGDCTDSCPVTLSVRAEPFQIRLA